MRPPSCQFLRAEVPQVWPDHCAARREDDWPGPSAGHGLVKPEGTLACFSTGSHGEAQHRRDVLAVFQARFHTRVLLPHQADSMEEHL